MPSTVSITAMGKGTTLVDHVGYRLSDLNYGHKLACQMLAELLKFPAISVAVCDLTRTRSCSGIDKEFGDYETVNLDDFARGRSILREERLIEF